MPGVNVNEMRMRSDPFGVGLPLTVAAIALTAGLALWLAISVLGRMQAVSPDLPRLVPSIDTQTSPVPGERQAPNGSTPPANEPAPTEAPAGSLPPTIPTGPSPKVERPGGEYGDMPIDPPLSDPVPHPAGE